MQWSWIFSGGTPEVSTETHPVVTYNQTGTYVVVLQAANSSGTNSNTKTAFIEVGSAPQKPIISASGNTLTVTNPQNQSIQWYFEDFIISGATLSTYQFEKQGDYKVSLITDNGCTIFSETFNTSSILSVDNAKTGLRMINLYPNPTGGNLNLTIEANENENLEIKIFDILGKLVHFEKASVLGATVSTHEINTGKLLKGMYLLQVSNGNELRTIKFVKN
jgi:PKD repeat protein